MNRKAIIIGATGLVGAELIKQLSPLYDTIIIIARRPPSMMNADMRFYQVNDFTHLEHTFDNIHIDANTDAFSCLGTTKKQAGGEEGFRKVDFYYNLNFAQSCHQKGVRNFFLLSAMGANSNSRFFYNQVKGELEQAIAEIGFESYYIFRPSLLLGKHKGRLLESLTQKAFNMVSPMVSERLSAHPISAQRVAIAMAMVAHKHYHQTLYRQDIYRQDLYRQNKQPADQHCQVEINNPQPQIISNKKMLMMTKTKR